MSEGKFTSHSEVLSGPIKIETVLEAYNSVVSSLYDKIRLEQLYIELARTDDHKRTFQIKCEIATLNYKLNKLKESSK